MGDRRDDPVPVVFDLVVELDERRDPRAARPGESGVEHRHGVFAAVLEHEP